MIGSSFEIKIRLYSMGYFLLLARLFQMVDLRLKKPGSLSIHGFLWFRDSLLEFGVLTQSGSLLASGFLMGV